MKRRVGRASAPLTADPENRRHLKVMSQRRCPYVKQLLALLSLAACFWIAVPANAQSPQDQDTTARELANFDGFMDGHPEIAEQLRKNPSLMQDKEFVANHPALQQY